MVEEDGFKDVIGELHSGYHLSPVCKLMEELVCNVLLFTNCNDLKLFLWKVKTMI